MNYNTFYSNLQVIYGFLFVYLWSENPTAKASFDKRPSTATENDFHFALNQVESENPEGSSHNDKKPNNDMTKNK